jgi:molecular chaperone GrpE
MSRDTMSETFDPSHTSLTAPEPSPTDSAAEEAAQAAGELDNLARLQADLEDARDRALRAHAELENFRKRVRRETDEELKYAAAGLIRDLLGVVDDLQRAVDSASAMDASSAGNGSALRDGVRIVVEQLQAALQKHHCRRIEALGTPFDPNRHEAVLQQPSEAHPSGTVCQVLREGYTLHDRVLRPAQVVVSTGPGGK